MFDIGFWELLLIAGIALLVVGPERLPMVLGTAGRWVGKVRRYISVVRTDIEREVEKAERLARDSEAVKHLQEATKLAGDEVREVREQLSDSEPMKPAAESDTNSDTGSEMLPLNEAATKPVDNPQVSTSGDKVTKEAR